MELIKEGEKEEKEEFFSAEIYQQILRFLSPKQRLLLTRVSKSWREIIKDDLRYWSAAIEEKSREEPPSRKRIETIQISPTDSCFRWIYLYWYRIINEYIMLRNWCPGQKGLIVLKTENTSTFSGSNNTIFGKSCLGFGDGNMFLADNQIIIGHNRTATEPNEIIIDPVVVEELLKQHEMTMQVHLSHVAEYIIFC
jgi:hypothetical protein